jgi:hypothetical protein
MMLAIVLDSFWVGFICGVAVVLAYVVIRKLL